MQSVLLREMYFFLSLQLEGGMYNMFPSKVHGINSLSLVHVKQYFMHVLYIHHSWSFPFNVSFKNYKKDIGLVTYHV